MILDDRYTAYAACSDGILALTRLIALERGHPGSAVTPQATVRWLQEICDRRECQPRRSQASRDHDFSLNSPPCQQSMPDWRPNLTFKDELASFVTYKLDQQRTYASSGEFAGAALVPSCCIAHSPSPTTGTISAIPCRHSMEVHQEASARDLPAGRMMKTAHASCVEECK